MRTTRCGCANPAGQLSGGTFDNIPLCSQTTETGSIVAYDAIAVGGEGDRPVPAEPRPCVDPSSLGGEPGIAALTVYNAEEGFPFPEGVDTDWIA